MAPRESSGNILTWKRRVGGVCSEMGKMLLRKIGVKMEDFGMPLAGRNGRKW
jgi:hypothetical protein